MVRDITKKIERSVMHIVEIIVKLIGMKLTLGVEPGGQRRN